MEIKNETWKIANLKSARCICSFKKFFFDPSNEEHGRESCLGDHLSPSPTNNCEEVAGNKAYKSENVKISNQFK